MLKVRKNEDKNQRSHSNREWLPGAACLYCQVHDSDQRDHGGLGTDAS